MAQPPSAPADERRSAIILTGAALLFSAMALCVKVVAHRLPGPEIACIRFVLGLFAFAVPLASGRGLHPVNYGPLLMRGLLGGGAVLLYFLAISHLPVGIATLLNSSWPVFVALFTFLFLDEPMRFPALAALGITTTGVVLVVLGEPHPAAASSLSIGRAALPWGLCGVGSALLSAGAVTTIRSIRSREGSWEIFFFFCLIGALVTAVPSALVWVPPTGVEWLWLVAMGACAVLAQMGMTYALRDMRALTAGIILQLTPIATLLFGALLFAEQPTALGWFGAIVTLLGITWGTIAR